MSKDYISTVDTAKLIRKTLKTRFPGVKFSVRSSTYSGGSSIRVEWTDGPTTKEVDQYVQAYSGADFDGMIDLKYSVRSWLMPDGTAYFGKSEGTGGSRGSDPGYDFEKPHPDARLVSFMADFVFTNRHYTRAFVEQVGQEYSNETGWPMPKIETYDDNMAWGFSNDVGPDAFPPGSSGSFSDTYGAWFNRHLRDVSGYVEPEPSGTPQPVAAVAGEYTVEHDRDWTWITFTEKPAESVRNTLKELGARWSRRRTAWYIRDHIELDAITQAIS